MQCQEIKQKEMHDSTGKKNKILTSQRTNQWYKCDDTVFLVAYYIRRKLLLCRTSQPCQIHRPWLIIRPATTASPK